MKLKPAFWPVIIVVLSVQCGILYLRFRPRTVTVSMFWECGLPEHFDVSEFVRKDPAAKPVTLRFVRHPNVFQIETQPGLCDALKAAGKREIPVVFDPIGEPFQKVAGYNILTVNGYRVGGPYEQGNGAVGEAPTLEEL